MFQRYNQLCPVTYGSGSVAAAGELCKQMNLSKVLVVSDPTVLKLGHTQKLLDSLAASGVSYEVFSGIETDAPDHSVIAGAQQAKAMNAEAVISIGGGSTLDTGKGVAVFAKNPKSPDELLDPSLPPMPGPQLPVISVPTTSGTGSENTIVAVITNTKTHWKCGVFAPPAAAIVDPELTLTVPADVTAFTGMDAFSHCSETLCSAMVPNPHSDTLAYDAIERIVKWLPVAVKEPGNLTAREHLAIASNYGGIAFSDAAVNLGHAMAHSLGANFHVPHGIACAWVTPVIIEYMADACPEKYQRVAKIMGVKLSGDVAALGREVAEAVRAFSKGIGIPTCTELKLTRENFASCSAYVMGEIMHNFGLKVPDEAQAKSLLERVYDLNS